MADREKKILVKDLTIPPVDEEYCGVSWIAIGLKITARTPAEANEKLQAFVERLGPLIEDADGVEHASIGREMAYACDVTASKHRLIERVVRARQARDN